MKSRKQLILVISLLILGSLSFSFIIGANPVNAEEVAVVKSPSSNLKTSNLLKQLGASLGIFQDELSELKDVKIPFSGFLANWGQLQAEDIKFYYSWKGISIGFKASGVVYRDSVTGQTTTVSFADVFPASNAVSPVGRNQMTHTANFFYGNLQTINVAAWEEIWYTNLYSGVDLRYYMTNQGLKYNFYVHQDADLTQLPKQVLESEQDLSISIQIEKELKKKTSISMTAPLVLSYSTFLGGNDYDSALDIEVDDAGNSYIIGVTRSANFPVINGYNSTHGSPGKYDVFVTKLNAAGSLVFSTFIGGNDFEWGYDIALDNTGDIYITGHTYSNNFPVTPNAYDTTHDAQSDIYVTKLNATGNGLIFSTLIGGGSWEFTREIEVDANGNSYLIGETRSEDFPTKNAYNSTHEGQGNYDIFVTKLNATGSGLVFSTFLGGVENDRGESIVLDNAGNTYIYGYSESANFPTKNAYNATHSGASDIIVAKLNATGNGLEFSTFLGGSNRDEGFGSNIALDNNDNIYITGYTNSPDFPTYNAYNDTHGGDFDVFLTKLNATGNGLIFSTFIGANDTDYAYSLVLDANNNIHLAGYTESPSFPTYNAFNDTFGGNGDIFLATINTTGNGLLSSTFFGSNDSDYANAMTMDTNGDIYIAGATSSANFPMKNAYNSTYGNNTDAIVAKFWIDNDSPLITLNSPSNGTTHPSATTIDLDISDAKTGLKTVLYAWDSGSNTSLAAPYDIALYTEEGQHVLWVYAEDYAGNWIVKTFVFTTQDLTSTTTPTPTDFFTIEVVLMAFGILGIVFLLRKKRKIKKIA
ncbi:MAG: SBBP repeat-containing protein [Promethearchaeota archaeon]